MATVDLTGTNGGATHISRSANAYGALLATVEVRLADAAKKKGEALANADVINVAYLPKASVLRGVYVKTSAPVTGATALTAAVAEASTGTALVTGFNAFTNVGNITAYTGDEVVLQPSEEDPALITLTLSGITGTVSGGTITVMFELLDVSDRASNAGLATRT